MGRQSKLLSITLLDHCFYALLRLARLRLRAFKTITNNTVLKINEKKSRFTFSSSEMHYFTRARFGKHHSTTKSTRSVFLCILQPRCLICFQKDCGLKKPMCELILSLGFQYVFEMFMLQSLVAFLFNTYAPISAGSSSGQDKN